MSLIKMLAFAKSLAGGRDVGGRFRKSTENMVPDFTRGGPRPLSIAEEPKTDGAGRMRMDAGDAPPGKGGLMSDDGSVEARSSGERGGVAGRWQSRNPFGSRPTVRADAKGQLTLEFVKVVRNDLSDADLELAPARPKAQVSAPPVPVAGAERGADPEPVEPEPSRWSRFTARIFRMHSTAG